MAPRTRKTSITSSLTGSRSFQRPPQPQPPGESWPTWAGQVGRSTLNLEGREAGEGTSPAQVSCAVRRRGSEAGEIGQPIAAAARTKLSQAANVFAGRRQVVRSPWIRRFCRGHESAPRGRAVRSGTESPGDRRAEVSEGIGCRRGPGRCGGLEADVEEDRVGPASEARTGLGQALGAEDLEPALEMSEHVADLLRLVLDDQHPADLRHASSFAGGPRW